MALKADTNFLSPLYQAKDRNTYTMSIQLRQNGLSCAIVSTREAQLMRLQNFNAPLHTATDNTSTENTFVYNGLQAIINGEDLKLMAKVVVIIDSPFFTLLPSSILRTPKEAEQQMAFAYKLPIHHTTRLISSAKHNKSMAMTADNDLLAAIDNIADVDIQHPISILHQGLQNDNKPPQGRHCLFAYISYKTLFLSAYAGKDVLFANSFNFSSKEDFIYYILLCFKQLHFSTEDTPLYLMGEIGRQSQIFDICWQYIRQVEFWGNMPNDITWHIQLPSHQYYILTQAALCE